MSTIHAFLAADHKHCDNLFAAAEAAAASGDWGRAGGEFRDFEARLRHHFAMEEGVLFPAFEERTGMTMGPTQMMRMEHTQMRDLLDRMAEAAARRDSNGFLGDCETLVIIMQQHNIKEEQILYPMTDQALSGEAQQVIGRMQAIA